MYQYGLLLMVLAVLLTTIPAFAVDHGMATVIFGVS
jgi:hypothetical protein